MEDEVGWAGPVAWWEIRNTNMVLVAKFETRYLMGNLCIMRVGLYVPLPGFVGIKS